MPELIISYGDELLRSKITEVACGPIPLRTMKVAAAISAAVSDAGMSSSAARVVCFSCLQRRRGRPGPAVKRLATAQSRAHRDQLGFYERLLRFGLVEASSPQRATLEKAVVTKGCGGRRPSPSPARASGPAVVIDAAAVIGAFQRIVRTADATGLDGSAVAAMDLGPHPVEA